ncbi:MAG: LysM peptidoglycan-binding domain-containing protein [Puniceicoccales bacterium]|jgi:LysM repeat protein|nr:LysM peptidoglycan-binding domain-containing protein [Puniceicoccales bacterium]
MENFEISGLRALLLRTVLFVVMLFAVGACERAEKPSSTPATPESSDPRFLRASKLRESDPDAALEGFHQIIYARSGNAPESHLEAGMIYLRDKKAPVEAIYHLKQFLRLRPNSSRTARIEEWIAAANALYARKTPSAADPASQRFLNESNLFESNRQLRQQNTHLKTENAALQKRVAELERTVRRISPVTPPATARLSPVKRKTPSPPLTASYRSLPSSYTVVKGDTLSRISSKIYGSSSRWLDIYNANRDKLPSENNLRPGMTLKIPTE